MDNPVPVSVCRALVAGKEIVALLQKMKISGSIDSYSMAISSGACGE